MYFEEFKAFTISIVAALLVLAIAGLLIGVTYGFL